MKIYRKIYRIQLLTVEPAIAKPLVLEVIW